MAFTAGAGAPLAEPETSPATTTVGATEPVPGRGQDAAPREVLSSDPEARALFLAGIQALDTMARWRRAAGGSPFGWESVSRTEAGPTGRTSAPA